MKAKDNRKTPRRRTAAGKAERRVCGAAAFRNIERVQSLMAMQIHMSGLSERLPARTMFDGIPSGSSPYYFYSLSAKKA